MKYLHIIANPCARTDPRARSDDASVADLNIGIDHGERFHNNPCPQLRGRIDDGSWMNCRFSGLAQDATPMVSIVRRSAAREAAYFSINIAIMVASVTSSLSTYALPAILHNPRRNVTMSTSNRN